MVLQAASSKRGFAISMAGLLARAGRFVHLSQEIDMADPVFHKSNGNP
jgi:hypothetical protein